MSAHARPLRECSNDRSHHQISANVPPLCMHTDPPLQHRTATFQISVTAFCEPKLTHDSVQATRSNQKLNAATRQLPHTQQSKAESRCQTNTKQISNNTAIKSGKPLPNQHQTHFKNNEIKSRTQLPNNYHTKHSKAESSYQTNTKQMTKQNEIKKRNAATKQLPHNAIKS